VDEVLWIDDPFVANRRTTTCPVTSGGVLSPAGQRVALDRTSADRDERVFVDPDALAPEAHAEQDLVFGTGPHACPGRPRATLELCVAVEAVVAALAEVAEDLEAVPERSVTPTGGYARLPLVLTPVPPDGPAARAPAGRRSRGPVPRARP